MGKRALVVAGLLFSALVGAYGVVSQSASAATSPCNIVQYQAPDGLGGLITWYACPTVACPAPATGDCIPNNPVNVTSCRCAGDQQLPDCHGIVVGGGPMLHCSGDCDSGEECFIGDWQAVPGTTTMQRMCECMGD